MTEKHQRLTIKDVAKLADVSFQTVSLVLNHPDKVADKTLKRVQAVIDSVNFVPNVAARSMRQIRTKTLACIFFGERASYDNRIIQIQDTYWNNVVQMLIRVADSKGYTLLQRHQSGDFDTAFIEIREMFISGRIDAMIAIVSNTNHPVLRKLQDHKFPFVILGTRDPSFSCITQSNKAITEKIVNYLYETGCNKITFISGERDGKPNQDVNERIEGFRNAMKNLQLNINQAWMLIGDWSFGSGYEIAQQLCKNQDMPDAIIFASDRMALGALKGLHDLGLNVPNDVSVVGFDNMQYDDFSIPPLTSVHSPILDMSEAAVEMLLNSVENQVELANQHITFNAELIVRKSTKGFNYR